MCVCVWGGGTLGLRGAVSAVLPDSSAAAAEV